jgi:hypothetical protein
MVMHHTFPKVPNKIHKSIIKLLFARVVKRAYATGAVNLLHISRVLPKKGADGVELMLFHFAKLI